MSATASMTARTAANKPLDTNIGDEPPLNVTWDILIEVPYTDKQRIPVPEQSIVVPTDAPCRDTAEPASREGIVSLMTLLQLHLPANTPDGNTMTPPVAELINCCTTTDDRGPDEEILPETLAAKMLPAASAAAADTLVGNSQPRLTLNVNSTVAAAAIAVENLAIITLLRGPPRHETAPCTLGEIKGVSGAHENVAPGKVIARDDCAGKGALGVKATDTELPDTTIAGWFDPSPPTIAAMAPAVSSATVVPSRSVMDETTPSTRGCACVVVDAGLI
jgi:hypothetical protein